MGVWVFDWVVVDVTGADDAFGLAFAGPGAGWFAAILCAEALMGWIDAESL